MPLLAIHSPCIKAIIDWCLQQEGKAANKLAPELLRPLLMSFAKPSPVCALLPPKEEMRLLIEQMAESDIKQHPVSLLSLQTTCPVLFQLVKDLKWKDSSLPTAFNPLLTTMWKKSIKPFEVPHQNVANTNTASNINTAATNNAADTAGSNTANTSNIVTDTAANLANPAINTAHTATNITDASEVSDEQDLFLQSLSFWPTLPTVRVRGIYPQDVKNEKQGCRKLGQPHKSLLLGTVTMHYQHGKFVGFYHC